MDLEMIDSVYEHESGTAGIAIGISHRNLVCIIIKCDKDPSIEGSFELNADMADAIGRNLIKAAALLRNSKDFDIPFTIPEIT